MVGQLSLVASAGRDDIDAQIARVEQAHARAFADQRALGRNCSDAEARAADRVVTTLAKKLDDLRARRIVTLAGLDEAPIAPPEQPSRLDRLEAQIEALLLSAEKTQRKTAGDTEVLKRQEEQTRLSIDRATVDMRAYVDQAVKGARALWDNDARAATNRLLEIREKREGTTIELEERIAECRRSIMEIREVLAELRDALRAAGIAPPPAARSIPTSGNAANNDNGTR